MSHPLNITLNLKERLVIAKLVNKQEASFLRLASMSNEELKAECAEDEFDVEPGEYLEAILEKLHFYDSLRKNPELIFSKMEALESEAINHALSTLRDEQPFLDDIIASLILKLEVAKNNFYSQN